jgi:sulfate transport system substrate-binding protein
VRRLALLLGAVALLAGCGGSSGDEGGGGDLTLVAYSTPREAYEELTKAFAETPEGEGVSFSQSYGASGEQSRAVEAGLDADVVAFSLAPDMTRLVETGVVAEDWADDAHDGMVTDSVVVLAVRQGNPKNVRGWDDLLKDDVEVITPNPFTSGGARWNVMAAYGAKTQTGSSHEEAMQFLRDLFENVSVQDKSARESLQTFAGGKGDVLIAYENEARLAQAKGQDLEYVVPDQTILIENPVAVTKDAPPAAADFVAFLRSDEAQRVFGEQGYRPVVETVAEEFDYPQPPTLFTIEDVGGWDEVQTRFFDSETGLFAEIQRELGQATG